MTAALSALMAYDLSDGEHILREFEAITLDPLKQTFCYFLPFLSAMSSGYMPIRPSDRAQEGMMPEEAKQKILAEIEKLCRAANVPRTVAPYTALNFHPSSFGGWLSFTKPILVIPNQYLFRPNGSSFGSQKAQEDFDGQIHTFSDNETRFFIARELGHLRFNDALLKTAAKVLVIAAAFLLYTTPIGWLGTAALVAGAIAIYLIADRCYEGTMDLFAIDVLKKTLGNADQAKQAALSALKKLQAQNIERRQHNRLCRLYITEAGNNLLDWKHPFITTRIKRIG